MQKIVLVAASLANIAIAAVPPPPPQALQPPPQNQAQPDPRCNPATSPDYVPGIDVHGKAVAPADLPSNAPDVIISTQVYPTVPSRNPRQPGTGVAVQLDGLGAAPNCQPIVKKGR